MSIAILGWGSLLWNPRHLAYDCKWRECGPRLPIEFARVSKGGVLTLVLLREAPVENAYRNTGWYSKTYWTLSTKVSLDEAVANLAEREGDKSEKSSYIGRILAASAAYEKDGYRKIIAEWLLDIKLDAVIWTDFPGKFPEKFSSRKAVAYVEEKQGELPRLVEYIAKAPPLTDTPVRKLLREKFPQNYSY